SARRRYAPRRLRLATRCLRSPGEPDLFGVGRGRAGGNTLRIRFLPRVQAVTALQRAHHALHLLAIVHWSVFLLVQLLVTRNPRRKLVLEKLHEVRARAVLQEHDIATDEARSVLRNGFDRSFELC